MPWYHGVDMRDRDGHKKYVLFCDSTATHGLHKLL